VTLDLLDKLRKKYQNAAKIYGARYFNQLDMEARITHLLKTRGNIQAFLQGEMELFNKAMAMAERNADQEQKKADFNVRVENILSENDGKIKKYPEKFFDPAASHEIRRLVGAVSQWMDEFYPVVKILFRGTPEWAEIQEKIGELERYYVGPNNVPTVLLKHYIHEIRVSGQTSREKIERKLLQSCALNIYSLMRVFKTNHGQIEDFQSKRLIQFSRSENPLLKSKWDGKTEGEVIDSCMKSLDIIVDDFRLKGLVEHAYQNLPGQTDIS
jgi:hypothetical protein